MTITNRSAACPVGKKGAGQSFGRKRTTKAAAAPTRRKKNGNGKRKMTAAQARYFGPGAKQRKGKR
jgi:hypothetical protein